MPSMDTKSLILYSHMTKNFYFNYITIFSIVTFKLKKTKPTPYLIEPKMFIYVLNFTRLLYY